MTYTTLRLPGLTMIQLSPSLLIGKGTERLCYQHPENPKRCIKVTHNKAHSKQQNEKDAVYYEVLKTRHIPWTHIPQCHGWVETDQGPGLCFDLIQGDTNHTLPSLNQGLEGHMFSLDEIRPALHQLYQYLYQYRIFTSDLRETNIICQPKGSSWHCFLIDGLGDRDFIKLAAHSKWLGHLKVDRQWKKFEKRLEKWRQ